MKKPVCAKCRGDAVTMDATAVWDITSQTWDLCGVNQASWCEDCDEEVDLTWAKIEEANGA